MRRGRALLAVGLCCASGCGLSVVGAAAPELGSGSSADAAGGADPESSTLLPDSGGETDAPTNPEASTMPDADSGGPPPMKVPAGRALSLASATSDYIQLGPVALPTDFTVEAWVFPRSLSHEMMVVAEDRVGDTADEFRLGVFSTGEPYFTMSDKDSNFFTLFDGSKAGNAQFPVRSPSSLATNTWTHLAVTKVASVFTLYVNGTQAAQLPSTSATFTRSTADHDFRFGARMGNGGPADYFDGLLDEIRVYSLGRTAAQITSDMRTELTPSSPGYGDLFGYWKFDEPGNPDKATDAAEKNDGTMENSATRVDSTAF